ncbi:AdoMet_MTases domain containing protein [Methylophilaceae bacterium]
MNNREKLNYFNILALKKAFKNGENITDILRNQKNIIDNQQLIEISYDIQAGSYIEYAIKNSAHFNLVTSEMANIIDTHLMPRKSILDIGTGELTTLSYIIKNLKNKPKNIFAFDISWSRIDKGLSFAEKYMGDNEYLNLHAFVGDIKRIPLLDKSIDIAISNHSLEPNGRDIGELIAELFRVTIDKLILFEPCYEINTAEGRKRMDKFNYIKNVDGVIAELKGKLLDKIQIKNTDNPLNPTVCYIVKPPEISQNFSLKDIEKNNIFSFPGTNMSISKNDNFYFSNDTGLAFPIIKSIPVLRLDTAILTSSLIN